MNAIGSEILLETKLVGNIEGDFYVPSYQRGYRWSEVEVTRLLDDIYSNGTKKYCLQPIVLKKNGDKFEVIDGQQRLTTIYLIYSYMHDASFGFIEAPKFTLTYETREKSQEFLKKIDLERQDENIDFYFICNAYKAIDDWFSKREKKSSLTNINTFFDENVEIIWYEVDEDEDAISLFERLNIGKIPLTSSELVKAMFLGSTASENNGDINKLNRTKQEEIALQWDSIEKELHDNNLWGFLSNDSNDNYRTRIDLVLDLIAKKPIDTKDRYYTFFKFDELGKEMPLQSIWTKIQHAFLLLKDWFEDHELYHKIGYLIATEEEGFSLQKVFDLQDGKTKTAFRNNLDELIQNSIKTNSNYADLSYENPTGYKSISRLLLLFNVMSVYQIDGQAQRFPFKLFKLKGNKNLTWSLEHIHAQQSQGMQKQEQWFEWLRLHINSVASLNNTEELLLEINQTVAKQKIERAEFEALQTKVLELLSEDGKIETLHTIGNLALLNSSDNAALNNSTFDVKRNMIIEKDKKGDYIPFCTKMLFLKYYTDSDKTQVHFWGIEDRIAYIKSINRVLEDYLEEEISVERSGE